MELPVYKKNTENRQSHKRFRSDPYGISDPVSPSKKLQGNKKRQHRQKKKPQNRLRDSRTCEPITMDGLYLDPDSRIVIHIFIIWKWIKYLYIVYIKWQLGNMWLTGNMS